MEPAKESNVNVKYLQRFPARLGYAARIYTEGPCEEEVASGDGRTKKLALEAAQRELVQKARGGELHGLLIDSLGGLWFLTWLGYTHVEHERFDNHPFRPLLTNGSHIVGDVALPPEKSFLFVLERAISHIHGTGLTLSRWFLPYLLPFGGDKAEAMLLGRDFQEYHDEKRRKAREENLAREKAEQEALARKTPEELQREKMDRIASLAGIVSVKP